MNLILGIFIILNLLLAVGLLFGYTLSEIDLNRLKWYHLVIGFQLLVGCVLGIVALIVLWFGE